MDYTPLIEKRRQRLEELETVIAEPDFFNDQKKASEIMREHRRLKELMETWDSLNATEQQLADNQELAKTDDPELAELAALEIPELEAALEKLRSDVQYSLLPRDTTEDRDAIIEIRAGTGGDEPAFCGRTRLALRASGKQPVGRGRIQGSRLPHCRGRSVPLPEI